MNPNTPVESDPEKALAAAKLLATLGSLELHRAEVAKRKAIADRNAALAELLRGRWGGPVLMGCVVLAGIALVGLLVLAGADLSIAVELARAFALWWNGCPPEV